MLRKLFLALAAALYLAAPASAQLRADLIVSGLTQPVAFVQDPVHRSLQFIVQQDGHIRVLQSGTLLPGDFLNLSSIVLDDGERGLLGLAFAPDYGQSRRFYVNFVNLSGNTVISRFRCSASSPVVADASSRFDLTWSDGQSWIDQPYPNHKGGNLAFGPDGYLYIGMGDGGAGDDPEHRAQNPLTLLGKMLRIDVSVADGPGQGYTIPMTNPFAITPGVRPEIWDFGLRNPWRWSFDDPSHGGTGALVIADVGQNRFEEIDYEPNGQGGRNYGWRNREGLHNDVTSLPPYPIPFTDPIFEYDHTQGISITGGYVYRGAALGSSFFGRYFFADLSSRVWSIGIKIAPGTELASATGLTEHTAELGAGLSTPVSFGTDMDGELYILNYNGTIYRIATTRSVFRLTTVPGDVNGDSLADLIWHNAPTGTNRVWFMSGTTLAGQADYPTVADPAWHLVATADVNDDTHLDLLWRHAVTGANAVWYMNGTTLLDHVSLPTVADSAWQIVTTADMNQDGKPDIIWHHATLGSNVVWFMNGPTFLLQLALPTTETEWVLAGAGDFNIDGAPDLVWRNRITGQNVVWLMLGVSVVATAILPTVDDLTWAIEAVLDINEDGWADLIWRNTATGANLAWSMQGTTLLGGITLPTVADQTWQLIGRPLPEVPADFNGDRHTDLVWRNTATGANTLWYLNGTSLTGQASLAPVSDLAWQIVAIADVNGDTHPDLVWRNGATGANTVWYLNGATFLSQASLPAVPDLSWRIVAAADINGDTHADLVWRNTATGANTVWYLNGAALISSASLPLVADPAWQVVAAADINLDTHPDLIWRNAVTGANTVWYLNGTSLVSSATLPTVADTAWKITGAADMDGDGHPDLVWRNTTTGANTVWYLNGTALVSQASLPPVPDTNWTPRSGG